MNLWSRIKAVFAPEQWTTIATDKCYTTFTDTGHRSVHFFSFQQGDRGGRRIVLDATGDDFGCYKRHHYFGHATQMWVSRGELTEAAIPVRRRTGPNVLRLVPRNGGQGETPVA